MFESVVLDVIFVITIMVIWVMLLYNALLISVAYIYARKSERITEMLLEETKEYPPVSVLIPAHNEGIVIARTLESMVLLDYPKDRLEVIVINDGSTDNTGEVIGEFCARYPWIRMVNVPEEQARRGKSTALNFGLTKSSHELIAVYDADNQPEPGSLKILAAGMIGDYKVAATVGKVRTINKSKNILTRFINIEFISHQWIAQAGRWQLHNITMLPGTNFIVRRKVLKILGGWDVKSITEDTELSLRILDRGYTIWYLPTAVTWEQEPQQWAVWYKQRTRWVEGNYYIIWKYLRRGFRNKKLFINMLYMLFTYYSLIAFIVFSDILFVLGLLEITRVTVGGPLLLIWLSAFVMFIAQIMIALGLEFGETTPGNILAIVLMYFTYCQAWVFMGIRAMFRPPELKKIPHWEKTQRF